MTALSPRHGAAAARNRDTRSAVDKAVCLMRAFGEDAHVGVGVSELARRSELSKSTTFRLLTTLERNGVVERVGTAYRLGGMFDELSANRLSPLHEMVREVLTPFLADMYEATHLTVQVAVLRGTHVVYLNKLEGHQRLRSPSRIGGRMPAYCTAVGKVLLAADDGALERALTEPRHAWTAHTLTDEASLIDEIGKVRASGVAYDRGEALDSLACIAAPVRGVNNRVLAALSISGDAVGFQALRHERTLRTIAFSASRTMVAHHRQLESETAA